MKVIVKESGFFGGTWFDAKPKEQDMPDSVAHAFLPPHGNQLSLPKPEKTLAKADDKKAG